jgi:CRP-like cAMP-binding protein
MDQQVKVCFDTFRHELEKLVTFTNEEWAIFEPHLKLRRLKKKELFTEIGKVCTEVGFIISGSIRFYHLKDGQEITNYFCLDNEFVSSYKSFLVQRPSNTYLQALEDCTIVVFTHNTIQQLLEDPRMALKMERFGCKIAEYLICCYEDRVLAFVVQTPEERYMSLLESNSRILQRIPQHYLANYLGITPVSLSRIRKRMFEPAK